MGSAFDTALPIAGGSRSAVAPDLLIGRNWLKAKIAFGLGLTVAWMCLLGSVLVRHVELAL
jgi:hypothetical protein